MALLGITRTTSLIRLLGINYIDLFSLSYYPPSYFIPLLLILSLLYRFPLTALNI